MGRGDRPEDNEWWHHDDDKNVNEKNDEEEIEVHKGGNVSYWVPSVGEEEYTEERTARSPIDTTLVAQYLFHIWQFLMPLVLDVSIFDKSTDWYNLWIIDIFFLFQYYVLRFDNGTIIQ